MKHQILGVIVIMAASIVCAQAKPEKPTENGTKTAAKNDKKNDTKNNKKSDTKNDKKNDAQTTTTTTTAGDTTKVTTTTSIPVAKDVNVGVTTTTTYDLPGKGPNGPVPGSQSGSSTETTIGGSITYDF